MVLLFWALPTWIPLPACLLSKAKEQPWESQFWSQNPDLRQSQTSGCLNKCAGFVSHWSCRQNTHCSLLFYLDFFHFPTLSSWPPPYFFFCSAEFFSPYLGIATGGKMSSFLFWLHNGRFVFCRNESLIFMDKNQTQWTDRWDLW